MRVESSPIGAVIGTCVLFALAAMITIAAFLTLVAPWNRQTGFYLAIAIVCTAEFVFFAWTLNWTISARTAQRVSGATLVIIHVMIVTWLFFSIITAIVIAHPPKARNYYADVAALTQAGLTLVFFALAYALYVKDLSLQRADRQVVVERRDLQNQVPRLEELLRALQELGKQFPVHAAAIDRLAKQLETVRTSLEFAPPAKIGTMEEDDVASTMEATTRIVDGIKTLREQVSALGSAEPERIVPLLQQISSLVEDVNSAIKSRQRLLTS